MDLMDALRGLPEGLSDNDPVLLEAMERKFETWLNEHHIRASGLKGLDLLKLKGIAVLDENDNVEEEKTIKAKEAFLKKHGYDTLTVPNIKAIRIDCIEHHLSRIEQANEYYNINRLPISKRLVLRQFIAFLEGKRNPDNDYIIPLELITELYDFNAKNKDYWQHEPPEAWRKRFVIRLTSHEKLEPINNDKFHLMVELVATLAMERKIIKNRRDEVAIPRFGWNNYSKYRKDEIYMRYGKETSPKNAISDTTLNGFYYSFTTNKK